MDTLAPAVPNVQLVYGPMYQPLILEYGQEPVFFPAVFMTHPYFLVLLAQWCLTTLLSFPEPLSVVLVSMPIQIFLAWRIHQLTKSPWIPLIISTFAIGSLAGGIWTATMIQILREFAKKPLATNSALLWFLASCVADVLVTVSLVMALTKMNASFVATNTVLDKIIRGTDTTSPFEKIRLTYRVRSDNPDRNDDNTAINLFWDLALSKLYSNCLLSTLNARHRLNSAFHASTFQQQSSVFLSPRRGGGSGPGKQESFLDTHHHKK
ncbi:hypothetical protein C8J57DRAFT_1515766 [Mycena rebaudengoi]|nr:hypothetical protein C8J57DRAFT_1515766 [Mycena rebaudengoi]